MLLLSLFFTPPVYQCTVPVTRTVLLAEEAHKAQPRLNMDQQFRIARAVLAASDRYNVAAKVLLAIARQESSLRPNVKDGKAGDAGICQVLKAWRTYPQFQAEFGHISAKRLRDVDVNFMVAAWILKGLKARHDLGSLPYWSYYNSRHLGARGAYFLKVGRYAMGDR